MMAEDTYTGISHCQTDSMRSGLWRLAAVGIVTDTHIPMPPANDPLLYAMTQLDINMYALEGEWVYESNHAAVAMKGCSVVKCEEEDVSWFVSRKVDNGAAFWGDYRSDCSPRIVRRLFTGRLLFGHSNRIADARLGTVVNAHCLRGRALIVGSRGALLSKAFPVPVKPVMRPAGADTGTHMVYNVCPMVLVGPFAKNTAKKVSNAVAPVPALYPSHESFDHLLVADLQAMTIAPDRLASYQVTKQGKLVTGYTNEEELETVGMSVVHKILGGLPNFDPLSREYYNDFLRRNRESSIKGLFLGGAPEENPYGPHLPPGRGNLPFFGPNYVHISKRDGEYFLKHEKHEEGQGRVVAMRSSFEMIDTEEAGVCTFYLPHSANTRHAWIEAHLSEPNEGSSAKKISTRSTTSAPSEWEKVSSETMRHSIELMTALDGELDEKIDIRGLLEGVGLGGDYIYHAYDRIKDMLSAQLEKIERLMQRSDESSNETPASGPTAAGLVEFAGYVWRYMFSGKQLDDGDIELLYRALRAIEGEAKKQATMLTVQETYRRVPIGQQPDWVDLLVDPGHYMRAIEKTGQ